MRQWGLLRNRPAVSIVLALAMITFAFGTALGASGLPAVQSAEIYRLPEGEILRDDLQVAASEIYIDGIVEGDLVAAGGYIEINGEVGGDALLAGAELALNGIIADDLRAAGAGITLTGSVGDDAFVSGGGGFFFPFEIAGRSVRQGVYVTDSATVGGDAFIAGGRADLSGTFLGNLNTTVGDLNRGNALSVSGTQMQSVEVEESSERAPVAGFFRWLWGLLTTLVGLALLGWLLLRIIPGLIRQPARSIEADPTRTGLWGLGAVAVALPLSVALVAVMVAFWGWFPGGFAMLTFLFGLLALLWFLSPLITGMWVGRRVVATTHIPLDPLPTLLIGVVAIVLIGRVLMAVPFVGELFYRVLYLISLAFALGGLILSRRGDIATN